MTDAFDEALVASVPVLEQLQEVRRELHLREHVYPGMIARGKVKPDSAQRQMLRLRAVEKTLERLWSDEQKNPGPLFAAESAQPPKAGT